MKFPFILEDFLNWCLFLIRLIYFHWICQSCMNLWRDVLLCFTDCSFQLRFAEGVLLLYPQLYTSAKVFYWFQVRGYTWPLFFKKHTLTFAACLASLNKLISIRFLGLQTWFSVSSITAIFPRPFKFIAPFQPISVSMVYGHMQFHSSDLVYVKKCIQTN